MAYPTVRGRAWFDTGGYNVKLDLQVDADPPPGTEIVQVTAWGESCLGCSVAPDKRRTLNPVIRPTPGPGPIDTTSNFILYSIESGEDYYWMLVQVMLNNLSTGAKTYEMRDYVWQIKDTAEPPDYVEMRSWTQPLRRRGERNRVRVT